MGGTRDTQQEMQGAPSARPVSFHTSVLASDFAEFPHLSSRDSRVPASPGTSERFVLMYYVLGRTRMLTSTACGCAAKQFPGTSPAWSRACFPKIMSRLSPSSFIHSGKALCSPPLLPHLSQALVVAPEHILSGTWQAGVKC